MLKKTMHEQHPPAHSFRSAESQLVQVPVLPRMDIQARPESKLKVR